MGLGALHPVQLWSSCKAAGHYFHVAYASLGLWVHMAGMVKQ